MAINLTIGNNGIFTRAQHAVDKYEQASINEQDELNKATNFIEQYMNGDNQKDVTLVSMYYQAIADNCTNADGSCKREDHLHIGDYLDFKNPTKGTAIANKEDTGENTDQYYTISENKNQLNWRVLGIDNDTGGIKLISGTPLKSEENNGYLTMQAAEAYVTGYLVPDKISNELYGTQNYVEKARSVKIEDINEVLGVEDDEIADLDYQAEYFKYGDVYSIYGYTPESYLNGEEQSTISGKVTGYAYRVSVENGTEVEIDNQRIYDMLFKDTENYSGYMLASQGITTDEFNAFFGVGGVETLYDGVGIIFFSSCFASYGGSSSTSNAIRPVIILENDVKANQIKKIEDPIEETW